MPYIERPGATLAFVGESPGRQELKQGEPFVGPAGKLFRGVLRETGIPFELVSIYNSARCLIDKKKLKPKQVTEILATCRPTLVEALTRQRPKVIVPMGDFALRQLLKTSGITKARGRLVYSTEFDCWMLPMFHPSHILRNRSVEPWLWEDMRYLKEFIDRDYRLETDNPSYYKEVQSIDFILQKKGTQRVSFDVETQGIDFLSDESLLISYSVSDEDNKGYQVFMHEKCSAETADFTLKLHAGNGSLPIPISIRRSDNFDRKLQELREFWESPRILKYMQAGNFDQHHVLALFRRYKQPLPEMRGYVMDIQAAAHVIDENIHKQASLDSLQRFFLKGNSDWKRDFNATHDKANMILVSKEDLTNYATEDAVLTRAIGLDLKARLEKTPRQLKYFTRFLMPVLSKALFTLEENGVHINQAAIPEIEEQIARNVDLFKKKTLLCIPKKIFEKHHEKGMALTRNQLIADVLFDKDGYGLEPPKKTKGQQVSIDKEARIMLLDQEIPGKARVFLESYHSWQEWYGLQTRGINQILRSIKGDGRLHTHYSITTAVTGRVASRDPNLMNQPKRSKSAYLIRRLFSVPSDEWALLEMDFSQAELRWIAHLSSDPEMLKVYLNDQDIHLATAMRLAKKPWDELTPQEQKDTRQLAKSANFGIVYGASAQRFARYCRKEMGVKMTQETAAEIITAWYDLYGYVKYWKMRVVEFCQEHGYVISPLGRKRRLLDINSDNNSIRAEAERMAVNSPVQNVSSDTTLLALTEILKDSEIDKTECMPVLFIHDSLVFQILKSKLDHYVPKLKYHVENPPLKKLFGVQLRVPMKCDISVGQNLAEMAKYNI